MSYDLLIWRQRPGITVDRAYTYSIICEDAEAPGLEADDWRDFRKALDEECPRWRDAAAPFACDFSNLHVSVSIPFSMTESMVAVLSQIAQSLGLTVFDPQAETVPASVAAKARRDARAWRARELKEHEAAEVAAIATRAKAGDSAAQLDLANRLSSGDGIRKNLREALSWYRASAEAGCADAMFNLAACYQYGDGTSIDIPEAIRWYERAAGKDKTYATFALGEIFMGWGAVARDNAKAEAYFSIALAHGHPDAAAALRLLAEPEITIAKKKKAWKFAVPCE
jgi:Sel1 repeat